MSHWCHNGVFKMANIRKRGKSYNVQIRRYDSPKLSKTFTLRTDAERWAKATEAAIDRGDFFQQRPTTLLTLKGILKRYLKEVVVRKKSASVENYIIGGILRNELASIKLNNLKPHHIASYRDQRLQSVTGSTVVRELSIINQALQLAINEWDVDLEINPMAKVKSPSWNKPRERRLQSGEQTLLIKGCSLSKNVWLMPILLLALETAMRRGELSSLKWQNINLDQQTCYLPITKNGSSRNVPLSLDAVEVLNNLPRSFDGNVFPVSITALRGLWNRACDRAGITDLHFHDLRHEATSRFFEKGLNVMEVATITGHKDLRMLQRYTHLRAEDLAKKLG